VGTGCDIGVYEVPDTTPPRVALRRLGRLVTVSGSLRATVHITDNTPTSTFHVEARWRDAPPGGPLQPFQPAADGICSATLCTIDLNTAGTRCLSVRATDGSGNVSAWTRQQCAIAPLDDWWMLVSQGWRVLSGSRYYGGMASVTYRKGETLVSGRLRVRRVGLVAQTGPRRGRVTILVGKTPVRTIDLRSPTFHRRAIFITSLFAELRGRVTVRVDSRQKRVVVDAVAISL